LVDRSLNAECRRGGWFTHAILLTLGLVACLACDSDTNREPAGDAVATFGSALEEPFGIERMRGFVFALTDLDSHTAEEIADLMSDLEEEPPLYEQKLVFVTWASRDAEAALRYALQSNENALLRKNVASTVLRAVAAQRPEVARTWFQSLSPEEPAAFRNALATALVEGWPAAEVGFEGVSEILGNLPQGYERERATRTLVEGLVDAGQMDVAMQWAESVPKSAPGQFRALAFRKLALTAGRVDPMRVSDWLQAHRQDRQGQAGLRTLARTWAQTDPLAALEWGLGQPDDRGRFLSLKLGFQQYYEDDQEAATAWLTSRPDDPRLDPARVAFALSHVPVEPSAAADQASKIQDAATRDDILRKVIRQWIDIGDAAEARQWVKASGLFEPRDAAAELSPETAAATPSDPGRPGTFERSGDTATEGGPLP
jgi:hypothetical protein